MFTALQLATVLRTVKRAMLPILGAVLIAVGCFCSVPAQILKSSPSPTPLPTESRTETQKERDEAETEYFRAQTAKLKEPSSQSFASNIPAMAAVFAGFVALVSFLFNYSANIKNQRDTQFYEALKRFGDKESARLRSSAAGILAEIALTRRWVFGSRRPYFQTALDQLITGTLLEENPVVLEAIELAIKQLFLKGKVEYVYRLKSINRKLTRDCSSCLAEFFASAGATATDDVSNFPWDQAGQLTGYKEMILRDMVGFKGFSSRGKSQVEFSWQDQMQRAVSTFNAIPENEKPQHRLNTVRALETAAARLATSVTLYGAALSSPKATRDPFEFHYPVNHGMFLAKLSLNGMKLRRVEFSYCALQEINLSFQYNPDISFRGSSLYRGNFRDSTLRGGNFNDSNLTNANLTNADLEGADLTHAKLCGAKLTGAKLGSAKLAFALIDDDTNLSGANWWAADFYFRSDVDEGLLNTLWKRYSEEVREGLDDVHSSVRDFIDSRRASD